MARLFFALWPDPATRRAIDALIESLPPTGKRVPAENLHVTLVFLGQVSDAHQQAMIDVAGQLDCPSFSLQLDRIGWWKKPRIVQLAPSNTPPGLESLAGQLQQAAIDSGILTGARDYRPHVTLKRKVKSRPRMALTAPVVWPVSDFCLVRSETLPEGARYEVIWHRRG